MTSPNRSAEATEFASAGPIFNSDQPVGSIEDDRLGVYPFVRRLARPLLEAPARNSLVIGLYGPWGYGKTSALNLLEIALQEIAGERTAEKNVIVPRPIIIRFTPWLYSSTETLLAAFFETLGTVIGDQPGNEAQRDRLKGALRAMGDFVAPAMKLGTMFLPLPGGAFAGKVVESLADALQGAAKGAATWLDGGEVTFRDRKEDAACVLEELGRHERPQRVVVMIDDLDRAGPEEVLAMLKLVKLAADLPNVSYVIAMDRARVTELLASTVSPAYGNHFLDKIVQMGVRLPPVESSQLSRFAVDGAIEIAQRAGIDASALAVDWSVWQIARMSSFERHFRNALRTPRDVVRLLNAFRFATLSSDTRADVHPVDLLLVCLLQVRFPTVYEAVQANRRFLLGEEIDTWLSLNNDRGAKERAKAERQQRLLRIASEPTDTENEERLRAEGSVTDYLGAGSRRERRAPALDILLQLFPWAVDGKPSDEEQRSARREGRIRSADRFDGYFRLDPALGEVQLAEVEALFRVLTTSDLVTSGLGALQPHTVRLSGRELDSLEQGLVDRAASMTRGEAVGLCRNLPALASPPDGSAAALPLGLIGDLAIRSVARLRTGVYGEKAPNRERERDTAMELLLQLIRVLSPEDGAEFADDVSQEARHELDLNQDERRALARDGLERSLEELKTLGDSAIGQPSKTFADVLWRCRRLADKAGAAQLVGTYAPIESYIKGLLSSAPGALADVLALGAAWTGPNYEIPTFEHRTRTEVRSSLARIADVKKLETLAIQAVASGLANEMRWPDLVTSMAAWASSSQEIAEGEPAEPGIAADDGSDEASA